MNKKYERKNESFGYSLSAREIKSNQHGINIEDLHDVLNKQNNLIKVQREKIQHLENKIDEIQCNIRNNTLSEKMQKESPILKSRILENRKRIFDVIEKNKI